MKMKGIRPEDNHPSVQQSDYEIDTKTGEVTATVVLKGSINKVKVSGVVSV